MDWLERINSAIDYIEDHLAEEIDYTMAAKIACCSTFHFQRIFSFAADMTLGEYIRLRRMTLAAFELQSNSNKVIDIALKYGYNSPTAFTRAFISVHGVTPKSVRERGIQLKSFPRITFHMSIKGGKEMNYRIEEKPAMRFVGKKEAISTLNGQNFVRIPKFWDEVCKDDGFDSIYELSNGEPSGVLGICANFRVNEFDYFIASSSEKEVPEGMDELLVKPGLWVVFTCVGSMPDAMQDVWKRIYTEWFPASGYEHAGSAEIEWYSDGDSSDVNYISEIWIPIVKK
ncbi:MAG: ydeE3 [Herbinix sp.]|jgi:AraC family transcriptional regulator|nr:ydeE3 [Herbinix sp.]